MPSPANLLMKQSWSLVSTTASPEPMRASMLASAASNSLILASKMSRIPGLQLMVLGLQFKDFFAGTGIKHPDVVAEEAIKVTWRLTVLGKPGKPGLELFWQDR